MRISDWSSDVCSSDLQGVWALFAPIRDEQRPGRHPIYSMIPGSSPPNTPMAAPRFFCPTTLAAHTTIELPDALAHHAIRVLRLKPESDIDRKSTRLNSSH